jgi:hypothetical protein
VEREFRLEIMCIESPLVSCQSSIDVETQMFQLAGCFPQDPMPSGRSSIAFEWAPLVMQE